MIVYITDRQSNVLCTASNDLPEGNIITADKITDEVISGVKSLDMTFLWSKELRDSVVPGNFILVGGKSYKENNYDLFQIISVQTDTDKVGITIYAEDAGMELINRICGVYKPTAAVTLETAIKSVIGSNYSGWNVNYTIPKETSKGASYFDFESEESALKRLQSVLAIFGAEMYFSYTVVGLKTVERTLNVVKRRGAAEASHVFHYGVDVSNIVETASIQDLATAFALSGKDSSGNDVLLSKFSDYPTYSDKVITPSDKNFTGVRKHSYKVYGNRVILADAPNMWGSILNASGEVEQRKTTEYTTAKQLISYAMTELEKVVETALTYDVEFVTVPEGVDVGDTVRIVDDDKEQYLESRVQVLSYSDTTDTYEMTLGATTKIEGSKAESKMPTVTVLTISSSEGLIGKNSLTTELSVTVFRNGRAITSADGLDSEERIVWIENGAELPDTDPRITAGGFMLAVNLSSGSTYKAVLRKELEE